MTKTPYQFELSAKAEKQFEKLDGYVQAQIGRYIDRHFNDGYIDPRSHGKPLAGKLKGYWRYDTGKYRLICDIRDDICTVIAVKVGHRREVYR